MYIAFPKNIEVSQHVCCGHTDGTEVQLCFGARDDSGSWTLRWCNVGGCQPSHALTHHKNWPARWWQRQRCFIFTPKLGELIQFDWYCSTGLKPPSRPYDQGEHHWFPLNKAGLLNPYQTEGGVLVSGAGWLTSQNWRLKRGCFFNPPIHQLKQKVDGKVVAILSWEKGSRHFDGEKKKSLLALLVVGRVHLQI